MSDNIMTAPRMNLLDEALIRWRSTCSGKPHKSTLPELMTALANDKVRDFPALRPHQRHPWHAFLVQLAVISLHHQGQASPWHSAEEWQAAIRALTPDDSDDAPWSLIAPPERPALLQAPVPGEDPSSWKNRVFAADALDMLVTSKNHDLKAARARHAQADDWLFALLSLQTQEGFLGAGNYGVSRMNGGFASRPGVGVTPVGQWGLRWQSDIASLLKERERIADLFGLARQNGYALVWLLPWSGMESLDMGSLDPFYIEICRRVRLAMHNGQIVAHTTGSKVARIAAADRNGMTGDPWTPIEVAQGKALTVSRNGFDYKLMSELLTGEEYTNGAAWRLENRPRDMILQAIAQVTVRGQGKTEGYHERRVPIPPKLRLRLMGEQRPVFAAHARKRIASIAKMRSLLWSALTLLFANGKDKQQDDTVKNRANRFARPFEQQEDTRFFHDLILLAEARDEQEEAEVELQWLLDMASRAEKILEHAFQAGPRSGIQRYKARSAALSRFHGGLRGGRNPPFPELVNHYDRQRSAQQTIQQGGING
ncbi:MAG: type I-E CRISPR-associated protein Cse1/CasA [Castellaniella sp.]